LRDFNKFVVVEPASGPCQEPVSMSGYSVASREDDPIHTVRTIARLAQMIIELRDEYVQRPRQDTLQQIEQRLDDMMVQRDELKHRIENAKVHE
jgi:hypothetical protein